MRLDFQQSGAVEHLVHQRVGGTPARQPGIGRIFAKVLKEGSGVKCDGSETDGVAPVAGFGVGAG